MGTGEIELKSVDSCVLDQPCQFLPTFLAVLFHDRSDQYVVGILFFDLAKFVEPYLNRTIGYEFDVFETYNLAGNLRSEFAVSRDDVYDFGGLKTHGLGHCATPAGIVGFGNHAGVGAWRARAQ